MTAAWHRRYVVIAALAATAIACQAFAQAPHRAPLGSSSRGRTSSSSERRRAGAAPVKAVVVLVVMAANST